jgi:hypothetical protein
MDTDIVEKIVKIASRLPVEAQRKALRFVESLEPEETIEKPAKPFRSVIGILQADLSNLEQDIADIRRESLSNFPREEPN